MVMLQLIIVTLRYVFGAGSVMMQEAMIYMHASLFLLGAGYTLFHDDHVRCDIFYRDASKSKQAIIDITGVIVFLIPMCVAITWISLPYVMNAWSILEGSPEGSLGLPLVFLLKTLIPVFATLLGLQGLSLALQSASRLFGGDDESETKQSRG